MLQPFSTIPFSNQSLFNPQISINSGQMFLWEKFDNSWYGVYGNHILKFSTTTINNNGDSSNNNNNNNVEFFSFPEFKEWEKQVFRLDDDIEKIIAGFSNDVVVSEAIRRYPGLRLMRQEPHQCMFSFVCASNTNILMIRRMLKNLSRKFGVKVIIDGKEFFTFPTADSLNKANINELLSCGIGYRAKAIKAVAEGIASGKLDIKELTHASYNDAKEQLLKIYGIGNKIADCILLFSLEKLESFPIDVWIARALSSYYDWVFIENKNRQKKEKKKIDDKITFGQYNILSEAIRNYFGKYSGYAQQYLFYYMRQNAAKKW
ncbi:MAG TPA: DNA glycosylase [Nitrososphaeraceae archaeon]|nr:DNA glycosylase [Nitrososphaeraceae archaeon]